VVAECGMTRTSRAMLPDGLQFSLSQRKPQHTNVRGSPFVSSSAPLASYASATVSRHADLDFGSWETKSRGYKQTLELYKLVKTNAIALESAPQTS